MAESDGGAESLQQQIDQTRRRMWTEEVDSTISSMRITREEGMGLGNIWENSSVGELSGDGWMDRFNRGYIHLISWDITPILVGELIGLVSQVIRFSNGCI